MIFQSLTYSRVVGTAMVMGVLSLVLLRVMVEAGLGSGSLTIRGLPLEYLFLAWFVVLGAFWADSRNLTGEALIRSLTMQWWWSIIGGAGTLWMLEDRLSAGQIRSISWVYLMASAAVWMVFVTAGLSRSARLRDVLRNVLPDTIRLFARPATWICGFSILAMLGAGPRSPEIPKGGKPFERWLLRQPQTSLPPRWRTAPVTLVEFRDYQSAASRGAVLRYRDVLRNANQTHGSKFAFVAVDFPLESECDSPQRTAGGRNLAACEAAAAVRLAREESIHKADRVADWLWQQQSVLTPEFVFSAMQEQFSLDLRSQYERLVAAIRSDTAEARQVGVAGVPTYFLNGRRLPPVSAEAMAQALELELRSTASK